MKAIGRNDLCRCGSGKKSKQCCLRRGLVPSAIRRATSAAVPRAILEALRHHQAGRLDQAEAICREILRAEPEHADALHMLGMLAHQAGRGEIAVELIGKAIHANPSNLMSYISLGNVLHMQGRFDAAIDNFQQALKLDTDLIDAHFNLGVTYQAQGRLDAAMEHYRSAIRINPNHAEAHSNLAIVLQGQGKLDEAIGHFNIVLAHEPGHANVHCNRGAVLQAQGRLDAAIESYQAALTLRPDYALAHYDLGSAFEELGQYEAAAESYGKAISHKPDYAEAHSNLSVVLLAQGKLDQAVRHCREAILLMPGNAYAYSNLLFLYSYHVSVDPQEYLALAKGWERHCVPALQRTFAQDRKFRRPAVAGRRLRLCYMSGDFRRHPVSYFIEQLFGSHDHSQVELFAYSNQGIRDEVTERLEALAEHWVPIAELSDDEVLERIQADGIDVLIDLSGHTAHNRMGVFARRAAPVQAHYLGYFASTGLTEMDFWIGDEILTPPGLDCHFSEQVWRLPRAWVSYRPLGSAPEADWHPAADGSVWLGSFNNLGKLTPATLALWSQVLHALPEGKLLLKSHDLADEGNRQRILDAMASHGIPSNRIELQRESDWEAYMAQYNRLDIALDPVDGHGGGTTTCDALWMGTPVLTLAGSRSTSRFAAAIVSAVGHPEWVSRSGAEYVEKVVTLARDRELREALRPGQRERMAASPLCDARDLAMSLENAYFEMFKRWQESRHKRATVARALP